MTRQPLPLPLPLFTRFALLGLLGLLLMLGACSTVKTGADGSRDGSSTHAEAVPSPPLADEDGGAAPADAEPSLLAQLLLAEGGRLEAQGRCREALSHYEPAALQPGPTQGQALAAIYRCQWQLQQPKAAQASFGRFLAHELAQGRLPLKLLFEPGQTRYLAEPRVSGPYAMWLRQLAGALPGSRSCLSLVGHAGPSATEQGTAELALRRAQAVQRQLEGLAPALAGRLQAEAAAPDLPPLIGSASDDWRDALDRRVSFRLRPC